MYKASKEQRKKVNQLLSFIATRKWCLFLMFADELQYGLVEEQDIYNNDGMVNYYYQMIDKIITPIYSQN